jgi:ABC-type nitrate/sulfonate/bicarbonate transport system ATPase subunit
MAENKEDDSKCVDGVLPNGAELLEELLVVDNVSKHFITNDGKRFPVLDNLSFKIRNIKDKPQILSVLGPSGCGKTTLMRLIAGLDKPDSGEILCNGKDNKLRPVKVGDVGVVFQRYPLFDDRTVLQNLIEPARNSGLSKSEAKEKALQYLEEFNLSEQKNSYPLQLSGGQRQRVAISQQLIQERHYIILDEPFSGLDPNNTLNVINLIVRVAHQHSKNTFLIVTHDITSALIVSDKVFLIGKTKNEGGRIVKEYDLIDEGLAYRKNIEDIPRFATIRKEIRYVEFPRLAGVDND